MSGGSLVGGRDLASPFLCRPDAENVVEHQLNGEACNAQPLWTRFHFERWGALILHRLQHGALTDHETPQMFIFTLSGVINSKDPSALFACLNIYPTACHCKEAVTMYGSEIDLTLRNNTLLLMTRDRFGKGSPLISLSDINVPPNNTKKKNKTAANIKSWNVISCRRWQ